MSGKSKVKLQGKSGKTISIGCCFTPKFANSGTLVTNLYSKPWPRTYQSDRSCDLLTCDLGPWLRLTCSGVDGRTSRSVRGCSGMFGPSVRGCASAGCPLEGRTCGYAPMCAFYILKHKCIKIYKITFVLKDGKIDDHSGKQWSEWSVFLQIKQWVL